MKVSSAKQAYINGSIFRALSLLSMTRSSRYTVMEARESEYKAPVDPYLAPRSNNMSSQGQNKQQHVKSRAGEATTCQVKGRRSNNMSSQGQKKQQHVKSRAEEAAAQTIALTPPSPLRSLSASAAGALLQQTRSPVANSASSTKRRAKRHNEHDRGTSRLRREDKSTAENKEPLRQRQVPTLMRPGSTDNRAHATVAAALAPLHTTCNMESVVHVARP
jgi:hypothetical protein